MPGKSQLKPIGTLDVISFGTTRHDPVYEDPIEGAIEGTTISHSAFRITTNDKELFDQYIAGNPNIPYDDNLRNTETGEKLYALYFSFWPKDANLNLSSADSKLYPYEHDCDMAAIGSPMTYSSRFAKYLRPEKATMSPLAPIFGALFNYTETIPPNVILHLTRLENTLRSAIQGKNQAIMQPLAAKIMQTAKTYCTAYDAWSDARIQQQNISRSFWSFDLDAAALKTQAAEKVLLDLRDELKMATKEIFFSGQNISYATLMNKLEEFMTFGNPELDTVTLPLVRNCTKDNYGLELEALLRFIKDVADNPDKYRYNVFTQNCATIMRQALRLAVKNSPDKALRHAFDLPWYLRLLPISPAMVMQLASKALTIERLPRCTKICAEADNCPVKFATNTTPNNHRRAATLAKLAPVIKFSGANAIEQADEEIGISNKLRRYCN